MTFEELKEEYQKDILLKEESIDKQCINLPKILAKYQFFYYSLLDNISRLEDIKNKLYYDTFLEYKNGEGELKNLSLSQTELKKLLETNITYREIVLKHSRLSNQLSIVEEFMSNIKNIGYSINSYITYKKMMS